MAQWQTFPDKRVSELDYEQMERLDEAREDMSQEQRNQFEHLTETGWTVRSAMKKIGYKPTISDETIEVEIEHQIRELANRDAAMTWSSEPAGYLGVAKFGDFVGIGGDIYEGTFEEAKQEARELGYEEVTDRGGRVPTTEQEISMEWVVEEVSRELDVSEERVWTVAENQYGRGMVYETVSGRTEVFEEV